MILSLTACNQSSGPGTPEECVGAACDGVYGSSDQNAVLQLERIYTNSRDVLVSWPEVPTVSDYVLNIADDEACLSIKKSLTVTGNSTHLLDLDEGVWYLCLKPSTHSQLLVIDRQAPQIDAQASQNLGAGDRATVAVSDKIDTKCSWSSSDENLKITDPNDVLTTFTTTVSAAYPATLQCEDLATNISSLAFTLNLTAGTGATAPGAPANVKSLTPTAGVNAIALSWADGGGAQSYLVLESNASITAAPADGMVYTAGSLIGTAKVKAVGTATTFNDTALAGNSVHYYKVFALSAIGKYASGVEVNATAIATKVLKTTLTRTSTLNYSEVVGLRTSGIYNYLCRGADGLAIINVSNPAAPVQTSNISLGNSSTVGWCSDVKVVGTTAYVADWDKGLIIVDVTNPAAPVQKGSVTLTNASVLMVEGNFAYVAVEDNNSGGGLSIINIANPNAPFQVSFTSSNGRAAGVAKLGNFIYLTHRSGNFTGLKVYDVTNTAAVSQVRSIGRSSMEEIEIKDTFAYIAVGTSGMEIFDVTTANNPTSRSTISMPGGGQVVSVTVSDNLVFTTDYDSSRMHVVDVTNKSAPTVVRTYTTNGRPLYGSLSGANMFLAIEDRGLEVVEVFQFQ